MTKVVIANAVLAGFTLSNRIQELGFGADPIIRKEVEALATTLADVMAVTESVDKAVGVIQQAFREGEVEQVIRGLMLVKDVTSELVSEQENLIKVMTGGVDPEITAILELLEALKGLK